MSVDGAALCTVANGETAPKAPPRGRKLICISNKPFLLLMVRSMQIWTHVFKQQTHRVVNEKEVNVPSKNLNN